MDLHGKATFIELISVGFIQNIVVEKSNKSDYPHHVIIKHRAICRCADEIVSTVTAYTRFSYMTSEHSEVP